MLVVEDLEAGYGDIHVLNRISLSVKQGEIVAVLGANAAGKTTMLRAISGVVVKSSGKIQFLGQDIERTPGHERVGLGLVQVPESRRLFPHMTVRENLEMGAFHAGAQRKFSQNLDRVLDLFPILQDRTNQFAGQMSGGEQQMCALARGLMADPKLIMIDEPTLGLAPLVVEQTFQLVKQIRDADIAVLLVEQNAVKSLEIADRAYVLERGDIVMTGTPQELNQQGEELRRAYIGL
ncbi:leucine/isoleucine/valine transporter ATP-binding subunit [Intrasporangium chromatireducens Q5-1]|uniref:Leucine/isoleucine/valine transporter ATP-binding subunit n=1 Tax=Intrasporangium chromatireducens Q5-1 TaxID=584657 RepID=W9GQV1_9MICO|nr:ABC transporter ATP-binding protein [Intrasporangium chromatireducens]EWT06264.1 leucine/isoleucine/valine transporter ATP-binding subunit [Intrasporangium chromatireducens Q5-1]